MQYTTHFNLMLPEGTDIVNPLVQQNPNFSDIDTAMYANKQASVGTATEVKSGTVHTITRANTDSNIIKFTATSNWTAGDSMVIDATPVSVYLSDGTTPATGAYAINTEVLLILSGSRVTLITSGYKEALDLATAADGKADSALELINGKVLHQIVADGVMTISQIVTALVPDSSELTRNSMIYILNPNGSKSEFRIVSHNSTSASFNRTQIITSGAFRSDSYRVTIGVMTAALVFDISTSGTVTTSDSSNTVATAGTVFTLYK